MTGTAAKVKGKSYVPLNPLNQTQISRDAKRSIVSKLNDQPALRVQEPPIGETYYEVDGRYYIALYQRILIRHRRSQSTTGK